MAARKDGSIIVHHFSTLQYCVESIRSDYGPNQTVHVAVKNMDSGKIINNEVDEPAYLYRGESRRYTSTTSSMHRMKMNKALPDNVKDIIEKLTRQVDADLQKFLEITPRLSAGFLQHYGLPTELIDATSSLEVAAYFASDGKVGDEGLMCIFPVDVICKNSTIIDLRKGHMADRAVRQAAFAVFNKNHIDFKGMDCIEQLGLKWFSFTLRDADVKQYHDGKNGLLDVRTDKAAWMLQFILDNMPKTNDVVAKWLSDTVAPAPMLAKVESWYRSGQPKSIQPIPLSETNIYYDEAAQRRINYETWSEKFSEKRPHCLIEKLGEILRSIYPSAEILFRLGSNWPAGTSLDYIVSDRNLAFVYQNSDTPAIQERGARQWCHDNGYRLIEVNGPDAVTEASVRSLIQQ